MMKRGRGLTAIHMGHKPLDMSTDDPSLKGLNDSAHAVELGRGVSQLRFADRLESRYGLPGAPLVDAQWTRPSSSQHQKSSRHHHVLEEIDHLHLVGKVVMENKCRQQTETRE